MDEINKATESCAIKDLKIEIDEGEKCISNFLTKKYKCVIIWLISIISVSEMIYLLLEKSSDASVDTIIQRFLNITEKLNKNL
jgi:hypothetical protein